jgi:hypothetical protein
MVPIGPKHFIYGTGRSKDTNRDSSRIWRSTSSTNNEFDCHRGCYHSYVVCAWAALDASSNRVTGLDRVLVIVRYFEFQPKGLMSMTMETAEALQAQRGRGSSSTSRSKVLMVTPLEAPNLIHAISQEDLNTVLSEGRERRSGAAPPQPP